MIKLIIFDWGGVLIDNPEKPLFTYCSNYFRVKYEDFDKAFKKNLYNYERGQNEEDFWKTVCGELNCKLPSKPIWENALRSCYKEKKEAFELAKKLKNQGYILSIISNTEKPIIKIFKEKFALPHYNIFSDYLLSCEAGYAKPEEKIFQMMLDRLKIKPEEAVFIDDKAPNLSGAKNIGIKTILFTDADSLMVQLNKICQR